MALRELNGQTLKKRAVSDLFFSENGSLFQVGAKKKVESQNGSINQGGAISDLFSGENSSTFKSGTKMTSAMGGADLRTLKRLQGLSRFGSTFFLSDMYYFISVM